MKEKYNSHSNCEFFVSTDIISQYYWLISILILSLIHIQGAIDGDGEEEYNDIREVLGEDKLSPDDIRTFATCSSSCRLSFQK